MDNTQLKTERSERKLERIVLVILSLYAAAMFVTGLLFDWSIYIREILFLPVAAGWFTHLREYWDHPRRAQFICVMCWTEFILYALFTESFPSMLITMAGVIVLLSIFNIRQLLYPGIIIPIFLFLYHGLIARTITVASVHDILRLFIQFFSLYTVSAVIWMIQKNRQEASELLIENIRELEIAERSKDDFLVNVSHEIRTPINAVCGMSEAVLQEDLPLDVRRDVADIQTAGRNLLSTVSNILDFSELEAGKLTLAEESYNITSTITDIINMALTMDNGRHLELIVDCDANLPSNLLGDEQKLRRIVMNLLGNAMKFTKEGGVILRITSRKEEYGINLQVSVRDSGIGIERADMEKIFTSFSQVNSKRNREAGGVGLGLAITQSLVRSMGGFLSVESEPGTGSEFQFTIPQKVLDETPIVSIKDKNNLFAACYINLDKYDYTVVREGYEACIQHIAGQFGFPFRVCRNLPELKRRMEREAYTHIFIGWEEYTEDRSFFDSLCTGRTVVLLLDYDQELPVQGNMLRIYKPFTVLSIAAVFNGQRVLYGEDQHASLHNKFIAPQANVLVVDDNAMNLKVMARLLLPYQLKVTMAGSGQEALEKLNAPNFDCVFLDHMMPEMDGVETLHKIRQKPGMYYQSLPVIAFTANAIGGAREMFMSEGFNDFIAKPIELSVLERILRRYIPSQMQIPVEEDETVRMAQPPETAVGPAAANPNGQKTVGNLPGTQAKSSFAPTPESSSAEVTERDAVSRGRLHLTRAGVDVEQALAYCGDEEGFREIIAIFHAEGGKRRENLARYFKEQDWKNYVICVHALKGNAKGVGAGELSEMARELEMAGKENRVDYILEHHEAMMADHDRLLEALDGNVFVYPDAEKQDSATSTPWEESTASLAPVPEKDPSEPQEPVSADAPATPADGDSLENLVAQIGEKLSSFESEGLSALLDRLAQCSHEGASLAGLADNLRELTQDFDFLGASEVLERMGK
ncbi:MAG: response regulator [Lachnospiraceae bacterium]|nr:response regulator [Lachnospiraceae bacterium]